MLIKAALLMLLYPAAQVLWLGRHVVDLWATDSACCSVKEGLYGSQVQHTVRVPSFSSQLCVFVLSIVGQLLYWLCCWL